MQLIGLLVVVGFIIFGAFMTTDLYQQRGVTDSNSNGDIGYKKILDDAHKAADSMSNHVNNGAQIEIYNGIKVSSDATTVDVSGRGLTGSLKAEIRQVAKVKVLDMSDNQLTGVPAEVGQLTELEVLNLSNNPFTGLPQEIGNLKKLKTLDLRGTNYSQQDLNVINAKLPASTQILVD